MLSDHLLGAELFIQLLRHGTHSPENALYLKWEHLDLLEWLVRAPWLGKIPGPSLLTPRGHHQPFLQPWGRCGSAGAVGKKTKWSLSSSLKLLTLKVESPVLTRMGGVISADTSLQITQGVDLCVRLGAPLSQTSQIMGDHRGEVRANLSFIHSTHNCCVPTLGRPMCEAPPPIV